MYAKHPVFALIVILLSVLSGLAEASSSTSVRDSDVSAAQITISGKVTDSQGGLVADAKVTLCQMIYAAGASSLQSQVVDEKSTAADGAFTLVIPQGTDPKRASYVVARKEGLSLGWTFWRLQANQRLTIALSEPKDLAGEVVDEEGKPVAEAEVRIAAVMLGSPENRRSLAPPNFLCPQTDPKGHFVFADMPAEASFEFTVEKSGRAAIATLDRTTYRGEKYQFSSGQTGIKLTLPLEARLEGVVVEKAGGQPVGGVMVMAMPDARLGVLLSPKTVMTAQDGTFRIGALTAGAYLVQLQTSAGRIGPFSGGVRLPMSLKKTDEWVAEPLRVTVKAGQIRSDLKLQLTKGGIFEVLVKDSDGKPVERATVSIFRVQDGGGVGGQSLSGGTDENGLARIRVAPGQYVFAGAFKEGLPRRTGVIRPSDAIAVEEGETKRIEHVLDAGPKVTGIVRDETGNPLAGVKFDVLPTTMAPNEITSDASGKFEAPWDPGMWGPQGATFVLVARDEARNLAEAVDLDEQGGALDVKLAPGTVITGIVLNEQGQPLPGARVRMMMQSSRWGAPLGRTDLAKTGPDGKFEIKAIPPDRQYTVSATAEGYGRGEVRANPGDIKDNRFDAGRLQLVPANLSLAGIVVDSNDQPVAGASVYGYGAGQPDSRMTQTDAQGRFTIKGVCPGLIRLQADSGGLMPMFGTAAAEGGATDLRIVISSRPTGSPYMPRRPTSLKGRPLPPLKDLGIDLPADAEGKMLLVCFWDMGQRPSRYCLMQLAAQAAPLGAKGVAIVAVHAAQVEGGPLSQWIEQNKIPFPAGAIAGDVEKAKLAWGVASLPHLILTDKKHVVVAEGFGLSDLDKQIETAAAR
jgi:protocatechuate 3,4-dioxygenase beta subunit